VRASLSETIVNTSTDFRLVDPGRIHWCYPLYFNHFMPENRLRKFIPLKVYASIFQRDFPHYLKIMNSKIRTLKTYSE